MTLPPSSLFPADVIQAAQASQKATGILSSVTLSQFAQESGYGKYTPSEDSLNFFGLKWYQGCPYPYVVCVTNEWEGGELVQVNARFIKFPTITACFEYHGKLLSDPKGPYGSALPFINDPIKFIQAISRVYASDPDYANKLLSIISQYSLVQFDVVT